MDDKLLRVMSERKELFEKTIEQAKEYFDKRYYEMAAIYLQIAANYAAASHAGFYYSYEIESLIKDISDKTIKTREKIHTNLNIKRVLHIASTVYDVGGHTALLQNWLDYETDTQRINDLVITNQMLGDSPKKVIKNFNSKETTLYFLKDKKRALIERAQLLYEISQNYDLVVLHIHPDDVIPLLSFANSEIPILFLNHADHRFWIGVSISNIVLEIRNSGGELSRLRRIVSEENQRILPIPLKRPIELSKEETREKLKIGKDEIIIFSVASPYKYVPMSEIGIGSILIELVNRNDKVRAIIIGPDKTEKYWNDLFKLSEGKIDAIGIKDSIDEYYIASDIYLDSYPVLSLTSVLDAAKYGLPIFSLGEGSIGLDINDISLKNISFKFKDFLDILNKINFYIDNPSKRAEYGVKCLEEISKYHVGLGWLNILNSIYSDIHNYNKIGTVIETSKIDERFDYPLVYIHHKNRTREYEYYSSYNIYFELFSLKEKFANLSKVLVNSINEPILIKMLIPIKIKRLIKRILGLV